MDIAIVDDEQSVINGLTEYFERYFKEKNLAYHIKSYTDPKKFVFDFSNNYDLICLDIEMPELNGIQVAQEIRKSDEDVLIMYITNMAQFALKAFEVNAVDYVLKPIRYDDFYIKMQKAMRYIRQNEEKTIALETDKGTMIFEISSIYYIEVSLHYLTYHTKSGNIIVRGSMSQTEKILSESFVRPANSFLINLKYVENVQQNSVTVNGDVLPLTRTRKNEFMKAFAKYIGGMK